MKRTYIYIYIPQFSTFSKLYRCIADVIQVNQPQEIGQSDSFLPTTELALKSNLFLKLADLKIKISRNME